MVEVGLCEDLGVGRQHVVPAVHLQPVPGVEQQRDVGALGLFVELAAHLAEAIAVEVIPRDDVEAEVAKLGRHVVRVVDRIGKCLDAGIGAVADHQRHAAFRKGRDARGQHPEQHEPAEDDLDGGLSVRCTPRHHGG